ncbi:deoxyribose-phosphate aldolase [Candidatus Gottesmanbacteria bacterium]|nr:deoxyribose-phosphate aldolase [Candidatus Gottesmanbacteria bacterium]
MIADLPSKLDLANHHADATAEDVKEVCANVLIYGFNGAFINPYYIALARKELGDRAKVGTALSFPLGQDTLEMKIFAAQQAIQLGADELDIVPNNTLLLSDEMRLIVDAARLLRSDIIIKFILETGYLTDEQIKRGAAAIVESGADFVKICSGMGPRGASVNDVRLVREAVGTAPIRIKAAGGIDTLKEAQDFLAAGAQHIGTSHAVEIIKELRAST